MTPAQKPVDTAAARDLLTFYVEAGVDAALGEAPVDRFADVAPEPVAAAPARPAPAKPVVKPAPMPALQAPPPPEEAIMAARAAARQAATLEELRAIMSGFEGCALRTTAKQL